ncbi:hypothetical protein [uncultured Ellagibacter sp.]|uniref:hypothetical protein n=1 Tax=uncultured Ellagibacter sp. TaxID=2137580 RepID=UPI00262B13B2|nr:hypothetical protein [uncultured Ellagibacter sp.]
MNPDSKTVRGLSIAIVVLAALGILSIIVGFAFLAFFGVAANDPSLIAEIQNELNSAPYSSGNYFDDDYIYLGGMSSSEIVMLLNTAIGASAFLLVLGLICVVVQLIAGIKGIKHCANPSKFSKLFGWTIAGIVVSVLACGIISLVLFIIVAVYVNKMKKLPPEAFTQQQAGFAGAQPYANQGAFQAQPGYYQQPYNAQAPYGQPGQYPPAQSMPQQPYGQPYGQPYEQQVGQQADATGQPATGQPANSQPADDQQLPQDPTRNNQ